MRYPFSDLETDIGEIRPDDYRIEISEIPEIPQEQLRDATIFPSLARRIKLAQNDHEDLHKITHVLVYTSGFLLTICLGAIYFSYNNSSAQLHILTKIALFISTGLLACTVLISIHPLRLSPTSLLGNFKLAEMLEELCDDQKCYTDWASFLLQLAVLCLLLGLFIFALDRVSQNPNMFSDLENITHLSIQVTRVP